METIVLDVGVFAFWINDLKAMSEFFSFFFDALGFRGSEIGEESDFHKAYYLTFGFFEPASRVLGLLPHFMV